MGLFDNIFNKQETRAEEIDSTSFENEDGNTISSSDNTSYAMEGNHHSVYITENNIENRFPVYSSILETIGNDIARLPVYLYKENKDGKVERIFGDYRENLLNLNPNDFMTGFEFKKLIARDMAKSGKAYSYIERENFLKIEHLYYADNVFSQLIKNKFGVVTGRTYNMGGKEVPQSEILPFEFGEGTYKKCRGIATNYANVVEKENSLVVKASLPNGVLETEGRLNKAQAKKLNEDWQKLYSGVENAGKTIILEQGLKYKPISTKLEDLNANEIKKACGIEVEKACGIPVGKITGSNNIPQNNVEYCRKVISPIINCLENIFNMCMLLEDEKLEGYYFRFDLSELLRGTPEEQEATIINKAKAGLITTNEARQELDYTSVDGMDKFMVSLGAVGMDKETKEITVYNTGDTSNLDRKNLKENNKDKATQ